MNRDQTAPARRGTRVWRYLLLCSTILLPLASLPVLADDTGTVTQEDLKLLKQQMEQQKQELEKQKQALQQQQNQLNFLKSQVGQSDDPDTMPVTFNLGSGTFTTGGSGAAAGSNSGVVTAQDSTGSDTSGETEEETQTRLSQVLADETGVLTPEGTLVIEPSLEYHPFHQQPLLCPGCGNRQLGVRRTPGSGRGRSRFDHGGPESPLRHYRSVRNGNADAVSCTDMRRCRRPSFPIQISRHSRTPTLVTI